MTRLAVKEDDLQGAVAELFRAVLHPSVLYFHIPNQAAWKRSKAIAGVRVGAPDWYLCWPTLLHGDTIDQTGWIELKSMTGSLAGAQIDFKMAVRALGHHWGMTRTIAGVEAYLHEWRVPMRGRVSA